MTGLSVFGKNLVRADRFGIVALLYAPPPFSALCIFILHFSIISTLSLTVYLLFYFNFSIDVQGVRKWRLRQKLHDARQSVVDVCFAPRHYGLKLVTCSEDGTSRIYEAANVTNLSEWRLVESLAGIHATAASWNVSRYDAPMLVFGCRDGTLRWVSWNEAAKHWDELHKVDAHGSKPIHDVKWAPCLGRSYHIVASAGMDGRVCFLYIRIISRST
jgi:WD40 repeat protein